MGLFLRPLGSTTASNIVEHRADVEDFAVAPSVTRGRLWICLSRDAEAFVGHAGAGFADGDWDHIASPGSSCTVDIAPRPTPQPRLALGRYGWNETLMAEFLG